MSRFATLSERPREEDAVTEQTKDFLKDAQWILKQRGFVRTDARNTSALFDWEFNRGDRKIVVGGWHGTGKRGTCRWFGNLKALLHVYDNVDYVGTDKARYSTKAVFDMNIQDGTVTDHTEMLKDALAYFRKA